MTRQFSADDDLDWFFGEISKALVERFGYEKVVAEGMCLDYLEKFQNVEFCRSIGIPPQNPEFFYHESAPGMAARVHYYLGMKANPDPEKFIEWRAQSGL